MNRPNVRELLRDFSCLEVVRCVEDFLLTRPDKEYWLACIDLLRLYGRSRKDKNFYKLALYLNSNINNPSVYRELSRFIYFIERDSNLAKFYAEKAIALNKFEPLWVYYIARKECTYLEKLFEGVYLSSIPKNASTSLKTMVLSELHNNKNVNPHSVFGNPFFTTNDCINMLKKDDIKLISLREPRSRFISYYNKNIIEENSLREELNYSSKNAEFGLDLRPSLEEFTERLNEYCYMFNDVLHHVLPQTAYFKTLSFYDCVADIKDSYKLGVEVSKKLNLEQEILPPKKMVSKNKVEEVKVSTQVNATLNQLFSDDINMYDDNHVKKFTFNFEG